MNNTEFLSDKPLLSAFWTAAQRYAQENNICNSINDDNDTGLEIWRKENNNRVYSLLNKSGRNYVFNINGYASCIHHGFGPNGEENVFVEYNIKSGEKLDNLLNHCLQETRMYRLNLYVYYELEGKIVEHKL